MYILAKFQYFLKALKHFWNSVLFQYIQRRVGTLLTRLFLQELFLLTKQNFI